MSKLNFGQKFDFLNSVKICLAISEVIHFFSSGQTDGNKEKRLQGHINTPLNEVGQSQAKAAGQVLKNVHFDKAYASDLVRTQETCALILEQQNGKLNINQNVLIKERGIAQLENILIVDYYALAKKQGLEPIDFVPEGGETREEVRSRGKKFILDTLIQDVKMDQDDPHVLMVSHGIFFVEFFIVLFKELGCQPPPNATLEDLKKTASNTSWSRFQFEIEVETQDFIILFV